MDNNNSNSKYINLSETKFFYEYLNHKTTWLHIFKPTIDGKPQKGQLHSSFHTKFDDIIPLINKYNKKGIICFAINEREKNKTLATDVKVISQLIIDIDVKKTRKKEYVSTDEDHSEALKLANKIIEDMQSLNLYPGMLIDSGNGAHIYFPLYKEVKNFDKDHEYYQKLTTFENGLKKKYSTDIIDIDCITKDINRRMKIPGTVNFKDTMQKEDRLCKIIKSYPENFDSGNINANEIEKLDKSKHKVSLVKNKGGRSSLNSKRMWRIRLNTFTKKDKELKNLLEGNSLELDFDNDRSNAELSLVNSLYALGFREYDAIDFIMTEISKIGKWCEKDESYKKLTFSKAVERARELKDKRIAKLLNKFESNKIYPSLNIELYYVQSEKQENRYAIYYLDNQTIVLNSLNSAAETLFHKLKDIKFKDLDINASNPDLKFIESQIKEDIKTKSICVDEISYLPRGSRIFINAFKRKCLNTYQEPDILDAKLIVEGEFPYIDKLLLHLCNNDPRKYDYLNQRIAYVLQNPTDKLSTGIVIQSPQGAGKNVFFKYIISKMFGTNNCKIISQTLVDGKFNSYIKGVQWIAANELKYNERLNDQVTEKLKIEVSDEFVPFEEKNKASGEIQNFSNWFFFSNNSNPMKISKDNRRFTVFKCEKIDKNFVSEFVENVNSEIYHYINYLINLNIDRNFVDSIMETQELKAIQDQHKSPIETFMEDIITLGGFQNLIMSLPSHLQREFDFTHAKNNYILAGALPKLFSCWAQYYNYRFAPGRNTFVNDLKNNYEIIAGNHRVEDNENPKRCYLFEHFNKIEVIDVEVIE